MNLRVFSTWTIGEYENDTGNLDCNGLRARVGLAASGGTVRVNDDGGAASRLR